jgi:hypothetical protein
MERLFSLDFWKFVFESMFLSGFWWSVFNVIGVISIVFGISYGVKRIIKLSK